mmetsp:Transcript_2510/g.5298  ORF Transcript_2510/g.5298 Transcript_2510/m.5298 type:complete len:231 (+) Transcript_2510:756-1448(+)
MATWRRSRQKSFAPRSRPQLHRLRATSSKWRASTARRSCRSTLSTGRRWMGWRRVHKSWVPRERRPSNGSQPCRQNRSACAPSRRRRGSLTPGASSCRLTLTRRTRCALASSSDMAPPTLPLQVERARVWTARCEASVCLCRRACAHRQRISHNRPNSAPTPSGWTRPHLATMRRTPSGHSTYCTPRLFRRRPRSRRWGRRARPLHASWRPACAARRCPCRPRRWTRVML